MQKENQVLLLLQVMVEGPQVTPVQTGVTRAGICSYTYNANAAGTYTVSATIHGAHVVNSPAVVVASIAEACAEQCQVKVPSKTLTTVRQAC